MKSKTDALGLTREEGNILTEAEEYIDKAVNGFTDGRTIEVFIQPLSKRVSDALVERYRRGGWSITYQETPNHVGRIVLS